MNKRQVQAARRAKEAGHMRDLVNGVNEALEIPISKEIPPRERKLKGKPSRLIPSYRRGSSGGYNT